MTHDYPTSTQNAKHWAVITLVYYISLAQSLTKVLSHQLDITPVWKHILSHQVSLGQRSYLPKSVLTKALPHQVSIGHRSYHSRSDWDKDFIVPGHLPKVEPPYRSRWLIQGHQTPWNSADGKLSTSKQIRKWPRDWITRKAFRNGNFLFGLLWCWILGVIVCSPQSTEFS